jgi:hypothetical protein
MSGPCRLDLSASMSSVLVDAPGVGAGVVRPRQRSLIATRLRIR